MQPTFVELKVTKLSNGKKFRIVVLSKATAASVASAPTDILVTTPLRLLGALQSGTVRVARFSSFLCDVNGLDSGTSRNGLLSLCAG